MRFQTTIMDDDGVAVVACPTALKARYAGRAFDYAFPKALLEGMNADELFAWHTGVEGEHTISVAVVTDAVFDAANGRESTDASFLVLSGGLLILPYSQFTLGCDTGGRFEIRDGLAAVAPVLPGNYRVRVTRIASNEGGGAFRVLLAPCEAAHRKVTTIPGWTE